MKKMLLGLFVMATVEAMAVAMSNMPSIFKLVVTDNANHDGLCQISRFCFYNAEGEVVSYGLTQDAAGTPASELQPGHFAPAYEYTYADGPIARIFQDNNDKWCFNGKTGSNGLHNPNGDATETLVIRLPDDVVAVAYNFFTANDNTSYNGRSFSDWTLYGSADGENWTVCDEVVDFAQAEVNFTPFSGPIAEGVNSGRFPIKPIILYDGPAAVRATPTFDASDAITDFKVTVMGCLGQTLVAAFDAADRGASPSMWAQTSSVGSVKFDAWTMTVPVPTGWGESLQAARFFVVDAGDPSKVLASVPYVSGQMFIEEAPVLTADAGGWRFAFSLDGGAGSLMAKFDDGVNQLTQSVAESATAPQSFDVAFESALTADHTYTFSIVADNGAVVSERFADNCVYTGTLEVEFVSDGSFATGTPAKVRVMRADTHGDLSVGYSVAGEKGWIVIPDGSSSAEIVWLPTYSPDFAVGLSDAITLTEGPYGLPANSSVSVAIAPPSVMIDANYTKAFDLVAPAEIKGAPLCDFPLLVRIDPAVIEGFSYDDCLSANGADLKFTDCFGHELDYEVDTWNVDGVSLVWVTVPEFWPSMKIRCHYGRAGETHTDNPAMWKDSGFFGIYHMNGETGSDDAADSTDTGVMTAVKGSSGNLSLMTVDAGPVGAARNTGHQQTVKSGNYFSIPSYTVGPKFTASGWFRMNSDQNVGSARLFSRKTQWDAAEGWEAEASSAANKFSVRGSSNKSLSVVTPSLTEWTYLTFVYNGSVLEAYTNGAFCVRGSIDAATDNDKPLSICNNSNGSENGLAGAIDEIRLRTGASSAGWIAETYKTMADADYLSVSPVFDLGGEAEPFGKFVTLSESGRVSVDVDWTLGFLGANDSLSLVCRYGSAADLLDRETVLETGLAAMCDYRSTLGGLMPGRTYFAKFFLRDGGDEEYAISDVVEFSTKAEPAMDTAPSQIGLWQGKFKNDSTFNTDTCLGAEEVMSLPEGTGEFERHLELGAVMAYEPKEYNSAFSGVKSVWGNHRNFIYEGYAYFKAGEYVLGSSIDDFAEIRIDGVTVHRRVDCSTGTTPWTCTETGWHAIWIGVGDCTGDHGPKNQVSGSIDGLYYKFAGGNKQKFVDSGDGMFLRNSLAVGYALTSIGKDASDGFSFSAELAIDQCFEGAAIFVLAGAEYGGEDVDGWSSKVAVGTVAVGETAKVVVAEDIDPDARYVRVLMVMDDREYWSEVLSVEELAEVNVSQPSIAVPQVSAISEEGATLGVNVLFTGGTETVDAVLRMRLAGSDDINESVVTNAGLVAGLNEMNLTGLRSGRTYMVTVFVKNSSAESEVAEPVTFTTAAAVQPAVSFRSVPGLWQRKLEHAKNPADSDPIETWRQAAGFNDSVYDVPEGTGEWDRHVELGAVMAYTTKSYNSEYSGLTSSYNKDYLAFNYEGYAYFQAGTYVFASSIDDSAMVEIDGVKVLDVPKYTSSARGSWLCAETGWYPIRLSVGDYTGGKGPMGSVDDAYFFTFNGDGVHHKFLDPGDGSFLIAEFGCPYFESMTLKSVGGQIGADFTFEMSEPIVDGQLVVCWGDALTDDAWPVTNELRKVTKNDTELSVAGLVPEGRYGRFAVINEVTGKVNWSESFCVPDDASVQLGEAVKVDLTSGDNIMVDGFLMSAGADAGSTVDVKILLATKPDMSDAVAYAVGELAAGDAFSRRIPSNDEALLQPATIYYWQVVATDADGLMDLTPIESGYLEGPAVFSATVTAEDEGFTGVFRGALTDVGASNEATVTLWTGADENSLTNTASVILNDKGEFWFPVDFTFSDERIVFKFTASNACSSASWTVDSPVGYVDLSDPSSYTWKAGVTEGDWSDPANWECSDSRGTYPHSKRSNVYFSQNPDVVVTVNYDLAGTTQIKQMHLSNAADVVLVGGGDTLKQDGWDDCLDLGAGCHCTFDNTKFISTSFFRPGTESVLTLKNGADFRVDRESWLENNTTIEVLSGSIFRQQNYNIQFKAPGLITFVVDNGQVWSDNNENGVRMGYKSTTGEGVFVIRGTNAAVQVRNFMAGHESSPAVVSDLRFSVPVEGYVAPPLRKSGSESDVLFKESQGILRLFVNRDSPAFRSGRSSDTKLIAWTKGIDTSKISLQDSRPATFYWTYGDNDARESDGKLPTGLWAHMESCAMMIIIR